jgi:NADPH:quinone reductase-like Zn-dependent oxidoreductase
MRRCILGIFAALGCAAVGAGAPTNASASVPAQQQAIVQTGNGGPEVLRLQTIPVLAPAADQLLICVYAAGVNPVDWKIRIGGAPPGAASAPASRVPGFDVAGVVAKIGPGVTGFKIGEPVFSMVGRSAGVDGLNGAYAHYVIAPAANVVAKPGNLSYAQAAGLGTAGMTAARVIDEAKVSRGQRVLITGVAGGVGSTTAQVAMALGAHVIGTASPRHTDFLNSIGVTDVIDYTQPGWADRAGNVDVVIDTVGADTAPAAFHALRRGGTFVSIATRDITAEQCAAAGVNCPAERPPGSAGGPSEGQLLQQVAKFAGDGKLQVHVDKSFPLAQAAEAQEYNRAGHTEGKVILLVTDQANRR